MANPWLRETFVIPGVAGQAARTINMIKIDDTSKGQLLALLKGSTTDQGPNPMPAIGLMGHTQGDVDFPINSINVGDQNNPNHVSFDDHTVRTLHAKALCARRGLKNDDTASPKRAAIERLGRSDANAVVELDILWLTPEDEAEVISFHRLKYSRVRRHHLLRGLQRALSSPPDFPTGRRTEPRTGTPGCGPSISPGHTH